MAQADPEPTGMERQPRQTVDVGREFTRFGNVLEAAFLWPFFGAITTISGVLAGYLGATWEDPIGRSSFYVAAQAEKWFEAWNWTLLASWMNELKETFKPGSEIELQAYVFLVFVGIFGACFAGTLWAQSRSAARATQELKSATAGVGEKTELLGTQASGILRHTADLQESASKISEMVRQLHTLPPRGFLALYAELVPDLLDPWFRPSDYTRASGEDFDHLVEGHLAIVLRLARGFDVDGHGVRYACNVMLFKSGKEDSGNEAAALQHRLKFIEPGVTVAGLRGVLDVEAKLSAATTANDDIQVPDGLLEHIALPIPDFGKNAAADAQMPENTLPGAPETFFLKKSRYFRGMADVEEFARMDRFSLTVRKEWADFFRKNRKVIASFMSFPIFEPGAGLSQAPMAVLNIHRSVESLQAAEKLELLEPLMQPILAALAALVVVYKKRASAKIS